MNTSNYHIIDPRGKDEVTDTTLHIKGNKDIVLKNSTNANNKKYQEVVEY